jgi:hypothetical protein
VTVTYFQCNYDDKQSQCGSATERTYTMAPNYRYISGDSHLEIDAKWWVGRVPKQYRDQAPRLVRLPDGSDAWAIEGQPLRQVPFDLYGGKPCA